MATDTALRDGTDHLVCERVYFDAITILSQLGIAASPVDAA
jgi:hypothetical protein